MITKIVEVTNNNQNWGKFLIAQLDSEWEYKSLIDKRSPRPLLEIVGWSRDCFWLLDLQTGEGACFSPRGMASADLIKHQVWVCPMFEPFLAWLYTQDLSDITRIPGLVNLPDAEFAFFGYRRSRKKTPDEVEV